MQPTMIATTASPTMVGAAVVQQQQAPARFHINWARAQSTVCTATSRFYGNCPELANNMEKLRTKVREQPHWSAYVPPMGLTKKQFHDLTKSLIDVSLSEEQLDMVVAAMSLEKDRDDGIIQRGEFENWLDRGILLEHLGKDDEPNNVLDGSNFSWWGSAANVFQTAVEFKLDFQTNRYIEHLYLAFGGEDGVARNASVDMTVSSSTDGVNWNGAWGKIGAREAATVNDKYEGVNNGHKLHVSALCPPVVVSPGKPVECRFIKIEFHQLPVGWMHHGLHQVQCWGPGDLASAQGMMQSCRGQPTFIYAVDEAGMQDALLRGTMASKSTVNAWSPPTLPTATTAGAVSYPSPQFVSPANVNVNPVVVPSVNMVPQQVVVQSPQLVQSPQPQVVVLLQSPQPKTMGAKKKEKTAEELHKEKMDKENEQAHARQQGMFVGILGSLAVLPCCFCLANVVSENGAEIAEGAGEAVGVCGQAASSCAALVENFFK
ncbi:unnamed protein product [Amoebophrya sp. A120]|nr:unnamed protein product [Amoebophrya sp. A120]|eukprot:GSA120T00010190001.1